MATYPNITWPQFAVCNDDATIAFEDMCRRIFTAEFLKGQKIPHADHNTPGVEVMPILEPTRDDGQSQKRISFQAKYTDQGSADYAKIKKSAEQTVKHHKGKIDLVYLFCNKTLTTTSNQYKAIDKIHNDAGMEVYPISNTEILDLVMKYSDIANYFFKPRAVADTSGVQSTVFPQGITVDAVTGNLIISPTAFQSKPANADLLNELVAEKLRTCLNHALSLELDALKNEVDNLLSFGIDGVDGAGELYYFKLLTLIHEGKDINECQGKCGDAYKLEVEWLIDFYVEPIDLAAEEYKKHTPITQVFAIDKLFTSLHWRNIVDLYGAVRKDTDSAIQTQLDLHYGLSLFNLHENDKASEVLHTLYGKTKELRAYLYATFADIRVENNVYQSGRNGNKERLAVLLNQLDSFKGLKQYQQQELLVAALKLESSYHLGLSDKAYLERAIEEYDDYTEQVRKNTIIQYYYALCIEMNGDRSKAAGVYDGLEWKTDPAIAERYMTCLALNDDPERAISVYEELEEKTVRAKAVYLFALDKNDAGSYTDELKKAVETHGGSLEELIQISYYTENEKPAKEIIVPMLKDLITEESLNGLLLYHKIEIIAFLAHCREIELMEIVLGSIDDVFSLNKFIIGEIYKALFNVANREYSLNDKNLQKPDDLEAADRIAERFLEADVFRKSFLQIKVLCAGAKQMPFSSLKYSKELFEITHDEEMARNIVALLFDRKETDPNKYAPYLEALEKSEKPDHCMVMASAMLILGREEIAEYYAYKALYFLNGKDDYNVFKSYFGFYNCNMHRFHQDVQVRSVKGNVVVMLEESNPNDEPDRFEVCLDSEVDFSDESNRSMGVEHITPSNSDYIKLRGSGLRQVLKLRGKSYQIVQIMPRGEYGLGYVFRKVQKNPEMFKGAVWMISTDNIDGMIKQIKELTDNTERTKSLLDAYHFRDNPAGLPIDAVAFGDYNRYIAAFKYLLYQQDEAFYAGQPIYENETGQKYVPGLATLILLSILKRLDVLDSFKSQIIIPESYITFFQDEYSKAAGLDQVSSLTLFFVEDKPVILEHDKTIPEIWEAIVEFCNGCNKKKVDDNERISFKISDCFTGERFITGLRLSPIHLDALILAQREKATFLCDDLFFRKVATWMNLRSLNIVSLIQQYDNLDYMIPFIMELSKTNYIYIPLRARNDEEAQELYQNILAGEKKRIFYKGLLDRYVEVRDRIIREFFGDEYIGQLMAQGKVDAEGTLQRPPPSKHVHDERELVQSKSV